jgi:hypothetical protein
MNPFITGMLQGVGQGLQRRQARQREDEDLKLRQGIAKNRETLLAHQEQKLKQELEEGKLNLDEKKKAGSARQSIFDELQKPSQIFGSEWSFSPQETPPEVGLAPPTDNYTPLAKEAEGQKSNRLRAHMAFLPAQEQRAIGANAGMSAGAGGLPRDITNRRYFELRAQGMDHDEAFVQAQGTRQGLNYAGSTGTNQAGFDTRANPNNLAIQQNYNRVGAQGTQLGQLDVQSTPQYISNQGTIAATRGAGSAQGALNVASSPQALNTATATAAAREAGQAPDPGTQKSLNMTNTILSDIDTALLNFSPEIVGPVAGIQAGARERFGENPLVGSLVGGPLSPTETTFRQSIGRVRNVIRNKQFGAALTPYEAAEAEKELVGWDKAPGTVKTRLQNLRNIFSKAAEREKAIATTPLGQLNRTGAGQGAAAGGAGGRLKFNPQTGKIE